MEIIPQRVNAMNYMMERTSGIAEVGMEKRSVG